MTDEATIGLAFAHIKVDGGCPSDIKHMALVSLAHQLEGINRYFDPAVAKQRIETMKAKLLMAPELILK